MTNPDPIYCVAFARCRGGQVIDTDFEYQHAPDARTAEIKFRFAHSERLSKGAMKVISTAPALGVHDDGGVRSL